MMADMPGAVTDPSGIKSEEIHFKSGTDNNLTIWRGPPGQLSRYHRSP